MNKKVIDALLIVCIVGLVMDTLFIAGVKPADMLPLLPVIGAAVVFLIIAVFWGKP